MYVLYVWCNIFLTVVVQCLLLKQLSKPCPPGYGVIYLFVFAGFISLSGPGILSVDLLLVTRDKYRKCTHYS